MRKEVQNQGWDLEDYIFQWKRLMQLEAISMTSKNQAERLGIFDRKGSLAVGKVLI